MTSNLESDDTLLPVVAHGLLNSLSLVTLALGSLREYWHALDEAEISTLLAKAEEHAVHVGAVMADLVRGLPPQVVAQFDALHGDPAPRTLAEVGNPGSSIG